MYPASILIPEYIFKALQKLVLGNKNKFLEQKTKRQVEGGDVKEVKQGEKKIK